MLGKLEVAPTGSPWNIGNICWEYWEYGYPAPLVAPGAQQFPVRSAPLGPTSRECRPAHRRCPTPRTSYTRASGVLDVKTWGKIYQVNIYTAFTSLLHHFYSTSTLLLQENYCVICV